MKNSCGNDTDNVSPHGRSKSGPSSGANQSRNSGGHFGNMPGGGASSHGEKLVSKHSPKRQGKDKTTPPDIRTGGGSHINQPYDSDGDDWL